MKNIIYISIIIFFMIFILSCRTYVLSNYRDRWGPPAKIEKTKDTITWYYYFYDGEISIKPGNIQAYKNYLVYEVVADQNRTVRKLRKYWMQPKGEPSFLQDSVEQNSTHENQ